MSRLDGAVLGFARFNCVIIVFLCCRKWGVLKPWCDVRGISRRNIFANGFRSVGGRNIIQRNSPYIIAINI